MSGTAGSVFIRLDIEPVAFVAEAAKALCSRTSEGVQQLLSGVVAAHYTRDLDRLVEQNAILRHGEVRSRYSNAPGGVGVWERDTEPLRQFLDSSRITLWHEVHVSVRRTDTSKRLVPLPPQNLAWPDANRIEERESGFFIARTDMPIIKRKRLKTVDRYVIRADGYVIPVALVREIAKLFPWPCDCAEEYLMPRTSGSWDWVVKFCCRICGQEYYCECFREPFRIARDMVVQGHRKYPLPGLYTSLAGSRPYPGCATKGLPDPDDDRVFRPDLCHICRRFPSYLMYCLPMYGNSIQVSYGPYIIRTAIEQGIGTQEAETEVRLRLGIPKGSKWISEFQLFALVKDILHGHKVLYQDSPDWLGKQTLDIFVPSLLLGIEYQGIQHYKPIRYFGGAHGFTSTQERDRQKLDLCRANGVDLLYFRYDETITRSVVERRLRPFQRRLE